MSEVDEKREVLNEAEEIVVEAEEGKAAPKKPGNPFAGKSFKSFKSVIGAKEGSAGSWFMSLNLPNQLTMIRVCLIPLFVIFLLAIPKPAGNILAVIVFIVACITDFFDGRIARRDNLTTNFGKFMDPLADKLLVCSALICLVDLGRIESWIVIVIIAREFIISGFRLIAMEKQMVIAANKWGKFKTASQMIMVILMVLNAGGFLNTLGQIFKWVALVLTVLSLCTYLIDNKSVLEDVKQ